jgi:hypothetical protein
MAQTISAPLTRRFKNVDMVPPPVCFPADSGQVNRLPSRRVVAGIVPATPIVVAL